MKTTARTVLIGILLIMLFTSSAYAVISVVSSGSDNVGYFFSVGSNSVAKLSDGNIVVVSRRTLILSQNGTVLHNNGNSSYETYAAAAFPNGRFVITNSNNARIFSNDMSTVHATLSSSANYHYATSLLNGNVILVRATDSTYRIINSSGATIATGVWIHGHGGSQYSVQISSVSTFANGNIMITSRDGKWQVLNQSGGNVASGTEGFSSGSVFLTPMPNGNMLYASGSNWREINSSGQILSSGTVSADGYPLNPRGIFLSNGMYFSYYSNTSGTYRPSLYSNQFSWLDYAGYTSSYWMFAFVELDNGNVMHIMNNTDNNTYSYNIFNVFKAPNNLSSTATQNSINVSWSANGNFSGTRYYIQYKPTTSGTWTTLSPTTSTSINITGLTPGTAYHVRVRAENYGDNYTSATHTRWTQPATPVFTNTNFGGADEWHPTAGRGWVTLQWNAVQGATKYWLHVFDGQAYRKFDMGTATSWDSRTLKIYPAEATVNGYGTNTRTDDIFVRPPQIGLDLRDNPRRLYDTAVNSQYNNSTNYWFRVSAENSGGEGPYSAAYMPTLPNRTDGTPPVVTTVTINDGDAKIYTRDVTLHITASDDLSGVASIQVSNDSFSTYETFPFTNGSGIIEWQLTPGEGTKTVHVRAIDKAGNISGSRSASVAMESDKVAPQVVVTINNGAEATNTENVNLFINAYDNVTPANQLTMRVSNDGATWLHYDPTSSSWKSGWGPYVSHPGTWTLTEGGGIKYVYVQVRDADGNIGISARTIFLLDGMNKPEGQSGATVTAEAGTGTDMHGHVILVDGVPTQVVQGINATIQLANLQNATHILFSHDNILWSHAEQLPPGANSFSKTLAFPGEGKRNVFVKLRNQNGAESDIITVPYLVDSTQPVIKTAKTNSGATATKSGNIQLYISASDNVSKRLFYRINGGAFTELPAHGLVTASLTTEGLNNLIIQVIDEAGNLAEEIVRVWKLE